MNFAQFRDQVVMYLDSYSIAGTIIPETYNNQADDLKRIATLANDAMTEIATAHQFFVKSWLIGPDEGESFGRWRRVIVPEDFRQLKGSGLLNLQSDGLSRTFDYKMLDSEYLLLGDSIKEPVAAQYYRYPRMLPARPADDLRLDGELDAQMAAALYVAAHLVIGDDAFQYASMYNEYQNKLDSMKSRQNDVEVSQTEDVYGFDGLGVY